MPNILPLPHYPQETKAATVITTPANDFLLAWEEMDLAYTVLAK
jgi:hypothetical protein